jgi:hypothetical protein
LSRVLWEKTELFDGKTRKRRIQLQIMFLSLKKNETEAFLILPNTHKTRQDFFRCCKECKISCHGEIKNESRVKYVESKKHFEFVLSSYFFAKKRSCKKSYHHLSTSDHNTSDSNVPSQVMNGKKY